MTTSIGIRDIVRNTSILDEYDLIEIEDKKTKKRKGLFVSSKYADEVRQFIEARKKEEQERRLRAFLQFSGSLSTADGIDLDPAKRKEQVARRKAGA